MRQGGRLFSTGGCLEDVAKVLLLTSCRCHSDSKPGIKLYYLPYQASYTGGSSSADPGYWTGTLHIVVQIPLHLLYEG